MDQEIDLINKNTRNERIINFFKKNYKIFILSISLIIIIILLFFGLEYLNKKKNIKLSNIYNNIISSYDFKNKNFVIEELKKIIEQKNKTYSPLSLFFLIDNDLITSKVEINNYFDLIINDIKLEKEIKNLIIYKKALYNSDSISEDQLILILNPIINSDSIWKSHSLYLLGEYFFSKGENQKAKEFFQKILTSQNANEQIILEAQKRLKRDLSE
jgi:predicted negative regulator of RcsB-dependent stress response